jgi:hypothetical protein
MSTREDEASGPDPPARPTLRRILFEALQDPAKARRLIEIMAALMAFGFTSLVAVVAAARGVHVQWQGSSISVPSIAALGTGSASVVALLAAAATHGVKKATQKWRKARKKALKARKKALKAQKKALKAQKVGVPSREPQTSNGSPSPSPEQHPKPQKSRPLPRTRQQFGRYRLRLG